MGGLTRDTWARWLEAANARGPGLGQLTAQDVAAVAELAAEGCPRQRLAEAWRIVVGRCAQPAALPSGAPSEPRENPRTAAAGAGEPAAPDWACPCWPPLRSEGEGVPALAAALERCLLVLLYPGQLDSELGRAKYVSASMGLQLLYRLLGWCSSEEGASHEPWCSKQWQPLLILLLGFAPGSLGALLELPLAARRAAFACSQAPGMGTGRGSDVAGMASVVLSCATLCLAGGGGAWMRPETLLHALESWSATVGRIDDPEKPTGQGGRRACSVGRAQRQAGLCLLAI